MKTTTLLKRSPTVILVSLLFYACYSVQANVADVSPVNGAIAKTLDGMIEDLILASKNDVQGLTRVVLRDPFRVVPKPAQASKSANGEADLSSAESLAGFVKELTLDATFLQGRAHIAIINGRIYHKGQHLVIRGENGKAYSPLFVESVRAQSVTLAARGKRYELGYPDQLGNRSTPAKDGGQRGADGTLAEVDPEGELAFYKRLLNSPLGKMGKSLTGNMGLGATKPGRARSRRARSSNSGGSP